MKIFAAVFALLAAAPAFADAQTDEALLQTQQMLRDQKAREAVAAKDPKAKAAHEQVKGLAGNAKNEQDMYELSAGVLEDMVKKTGGDSKELQEMLEKAQKDPAGFAKSFSPEQQKQLKAIEQEIDHPDGGSAKAPQ